MEKRFPDLPPREQLKRLVHINEEADITVNFTALFGLLFEGKLKIGKVSSMLEVGRRMAQKKIQKSNEDEGVVCGLYNVGMVRGD